MSESKFTTPMAIVVAGALIGVAIYFSGASPLSLTKDTVGSKTTGTGNAPAAQPTTADPLSQKPVDVSIKDEPFLGKEDAPVTVVEFTDFQCPFCKRAFDSNWSQLKSEYIDTGKVKYVVRDFPLSFHQNAQAAANAANCAYDQGGNEDYFTYHDMLFNKQGDWESLSGEKAAEKFKEFASEANLNADEFASCLDEKKYDDEISKDIADGQTAGVGGTPSFFINGKLLVGAQPYSEIKRMIDASLEG